jgi:hypothetical protein
VNPHTVMSGTKGQESGKSGHGHVGFALAQNAKSPRILNSISAFQVVQKMYLIR